MLTVVSNLKNAMFPLSACGVNTEQTFDNFICTEANAAAYGFATAVSLSFESKRSPLLICGPINSGKTHLMNAIANQWRRFEPVGKLKLMAASAFLAPQQLDRSLVTLDMLLVDGVESISSNKAAQDLLLITCETLRVRGKQTILAIDTETNELQAINAKLVGFFNTGICVMLGRAFSPPELIRPLPHATTHQPLPGKVSQHSAQYVTGTR